MSRLRALTKPLSTTLDAADRFQTSPSLQRDQRFFATLDAIRGTAAILVVLRQTSIFWGSEFESSYLAVDVFFVLSGVVIANAYEHKLRQTMTFQAFAWRRMVRVYPLYALGTLITIAGLLMGFPSSIRPQDIGLFALCGALLIPVVPTFSTNVPAVMYPLNAPAWSLTCELIVNAVYAAALPWLTWRRIAVIMLTAALGCIGIIAYVQTHDLNAGFTLKSAPAGLIRTTYSFFAGVLLLRLYRQSGSPQLPPRPSATRSIAILAALIAILIADPPQALVPIYSFVAVTVLIPALIWAAMHCEPPGRLRDLYVFLGAISFALYTLHEPLLFWFENVVRHAAPGSVETWGIQLGALYLTITITACWFIHSRLDEPLRRRLTDWSSRTKPAPKSQPAQTHP